MLTFLLGIVIAIFLGWQFVVGEYVGAVLLILLTWLIVRMTRPAGLIREARDRARRDAGENADSSATSWTELIKSKEGWNRVADQYVMEWRMVWKDVTIGFTVAGIIAAFVPRTFFERLFVGSGTSGAPFHEILVQSLVGPVAAFATFIGSMGNIPLAAVLFSNGVSFAGVMAFIFSDLVVFPVLRIQASYYGWKMALYIAGVFLVVLVTTAIVLHYAFAALGLLPDPASARSVVEREYFSIDYTFFLDM
ncbi:MAG: permease, partial [Gammaproteobacteria bacterium]